MEKTTKKIKKLPISKAVFRKLIEGNFCYVDKTKYIYELNETDTTYWFLSRPRRFGKSLLLDTLRAAFAGEKELFKDLFLEKNWDWDTKYPVIKVSFGGGTVSDIAGFQETANFSLQTIANKYNVKLGEFEFAATKFKGLIEDLYKKFNLPVVVLIDEYDKPILDNISKT